MNPTLLRILDANLNRAREALRVVEDYARFVLDDAKLSANLKELRHHLAAATCRYADHALLTRDTPGDVGTANTTPQEFARAGLSAVVTAAGKRLGEALRTIEEFLKIESPDDAANVELIRYQFYDVELRVARTLRPPGIFGGVRLYVLITESACRLPWLEVAKEAIAGGADCLQLREKDLDGGELLRRATTLLEMCRAAGVLFIVNDRADVALLADADGVHLGQTDLPAAEARKLLGPDKIIGVSTHHIDQARQAVADGADYIGVGPVFPSLTKPRDIHPGLPYAEEVATEIQIPAIAIAGITADNLDQVLNTGVRAIAVTAAVTGSEDPRAATARLMARLTTVGQTFLSARNDRPGLRTVSPGPNHPGGADILVCPSNPPGVTATPLNQGGVNILVCPSKPSLTQPPSPGPTPPGGVDILVCLPPTSSSNTTSPSPNPEPQFKKYTRRLPHWRLTGATYFVTFRIKQGEFRPAERTVILDHVRAGDPRYYTLIAATVMPDHVHLILRPAPGVELSRIMQGTKGALAKKINDLRDVRGHVWQDESWDRIMRDPAELNEKIQYCLENPVNKGLVEDPWDYPWWYYKPDQKT